ncbi:hypothetical protein OEZ86_006103 [Tetradesmus obliquus]|nr:hypothetical protein OEZ86_006103 [Tetradesmus obliquus]
MRVTGSNAQFSPNLSSKTTSPSPGPSTSSCPGLDTSRYGLVPVSRCPPSPPENASLELQQLVNTTVTVIVKEGRDPFSSLPPSEQQVLSKAQFVKYEDVPLAVRQALNLTGVQGVEGLLYLSSFGHYQIKASSAEALNDVITAISQLGDTVDAIARNGYTSTAGA